jgi:hypothetical protein
LWRQSKYATQNAGRPLTAKQLRRIKKKMRVQAAASKRRTLRRLMGKS